ncbi:MAG: phage holin, LLH family [Candidatus Dehalobacter alkaniphilus]
MKDYLLMFLMANWDSILFVVVALVVLLVLLKKGYKARVAEVLFYLVTKAEQELGGGTGELKFAAVTTWLYEKLPAIAKLIFTKKQLDAMIEAAVTRMKEYLTVNESAKKLIVQK